MNILILGATGTVGRHFLPLALAHGHNLTALVRDPAKVEPAPGLRILQGDALDPAALDRALPGHDAVLYTLGLPSIRRTTLFTDSTRLLLPAMERHGVRRLVCVTGVGAGDTRGHGGFFYDWFLYPLFTRPRYRDKTVQEEMIRNSRLDWTIVRPAPFFEGPSKMPLRAETRLEGVVLRRISRAEVAAFLLDELETGKFIRQSPFIGHER